MTVGLDRDDIIAGLRALIAELRSANEIAHIRLVGGAAIALRHFERGTTQDLDALHIHPGTDTAVAAAASRVAERYGWAPEWFNFAVNSVDALPEWGRPAEWETLYESSGIVIQVASKETLLAMKLRANRPGRDTRDIRLLLGLCRMRSVDEVEAFYEQFYPGDGLSDRAVHMVSSILAGGDVPRPSSPGPVDLRW